MTEISMPWDGETLGDATLAKYSSKEFMEEFLQLLFVYDRTAEGVIDTGYGGLTGGLVVAGGAGVVTVQTGAAMVDGRLYKNDAVLTLTPTTGTRTDRVVLRRDAAAQTVRAVIKEGTLGTPPALTQTAATWEISLAQFIVTAGPTIGTVTNEARAIRTPLGPGYQAATLSADDTAHSAGAWNSLGASGVKVTLGPGKWLIFGQITFNNSVITAGSRYARIYNSTSAVQLANGAAMVTASGGDISIPIRPTVVTLTAVNVLELQFYAADANDRVYGDSAATPDQDSTGLVAIRVI